MPWPTGCAFPGNKKLRDIEGDHKGRPHYAATTLFFIIQLFDAATGHGSAGAPWSTQAH